MRTAEAEELGQKLATSFPRSAVSVTAWTEQLVECERGPAEAAVRTLIRTSEHPPTIAHFWSTYRAMFTPTKNKPDEVLCTTCGDSGWVTDRNHPNHWPGAPERRPVFINGYGTHHDECMCNVVAPCPMCGQRQKIA